jgi:hypothetical protein
MEDISRRAFAANLLTSLATVCVLKTAYEGDLFAQPVKPTTDEWLKGLHELFSDLRTNKVSQIQWQRQIVPRLARIELPELLRFIDFAQLEKRITMPDYGLAVERVNFPKPAWMPDERGWAMKVFALDKGCAILPHGHHNMVSVHMILKGAMHVRHYDRVEEGSRHVVMKPTIDRVSSPGEATTISDDKDNIHWLKNTGDGRAYILDVVADRLNPGLGYGYQQFYVDPLNGERLGGDLIRTRKLEYEEAARLYRRS